MTTELLEDTDFDVGTGFSDTDDPTKAQHYFHKNEIGKLMAGVPATALCGYIKSPPLQSTAGLSICSECQDAMDNVVGSNLPYDPNDKADTPL